jgi:hypothetical protein
MGAKGKSAPRVHINIRLKPHVLETLRLGAVYHGIKYQTYLQWLLEEGLKSEAQYYGWSTPFPRYTTQGPTKTQQEEIQHLVRMAKRKANRTES